jgi:protocatechuate 3,4-dioxygenase beta subunit
MIRTAALHLIVTACLCAALTSCGGGDGAAGPPPAKSPAEIEIVSGNVQQGVVGTELPQPLVAKVLDAQGNPIAGQVVNFVVTSGGGHVFAGSSASNANGIVQERWTLGTSTAVLQTLEARAVDNSSGAAIVLGRFTATALADAAQNVVVSSGSGQTAAAGSAPTDSLAAKVMDQYGNPVANATVQWTVTAGGGSVSPASVTTNAAGLAKTRLTLGASRGANAVTATVTGLAPATFTANAIAGAAASLVIVSGDAQTGPVGSYLPGTLTVRALDAFGNPVAGATVTWAAAVGSGSAESATSATDVDGLASSRWALGEHPGVASATASIAGGGSVTFHATATVGAATTLTAVSGNGQAAVVGSRITDSLVVKLADAFGNPIAGTAVQWVPMTNGTHVSPTDVITDAAGMARTALTVRTTSGTNIVTATVSGLPSVDFSATGVAGDATTIQAFGATTQSGAVGSTVTLSVQALDEYGNAASGSTIAWAVVSGGGSFVESTTTSGTDGVAAAAWVLGTQTGQNSATARLANGSSVTFTTNATPGPVTVLQKVSGDAQSGQVPVVLPESLVVRAMDQYGNLVPATSISWDGGSLGSISPLSTMTDAQGLARAQWTLARAGQASATARDVSSGRSVVFTATGAPSTGPALIIVSGNGQTNIAMEYLQDLVVQLNDANGQPVAGARVIWTSSSNEASINGNGYTNSAGTASARVQLPSSAGPLTVTATSGTVAPAVFSAMAVAGPWCSSHIVLNGPSTAPPGGTVTVWQVSTDWAGNPAAQTTVGDRLTVSDGGIVTWRDSIPGLRIGTWTLGNKVGTQTLTYRYAFCGGFSPKSGFPRSGSENDVINVDVVAPSP